MPDLARTDMDFSSVGAAPITKFDDGTGWELVTISGTDLGVAPNLSGVAAGEGGLFSPKTTVATPTNEAAISSEIVLLADTSGGAPTLGVVHGSLTDPVSLGFQIVRLNPTLGIYFAQDLGADDFPRNFFYYTTSPSNVYQKPTLYTKDASLNLVNGRRARLEFDRGSELAGYIMPVYDVIYVGSNYATLNGGAFSGGVISFSGIGTVTGQGGIINNVAYSDTVALGQHLYELGSKTFTLDGLTNTTDLRLIIFDQSSNVVLPSFSPSDHPSLAFTDALLVPASGTGGGAITVYSPYSALTYGNYRYSQKLSGDVRLSDFSNVNTHSVRAVVTDSDPVVSPYGYSFEASINTDGSINFDLKHHNTGTVLASFSKTAGSVSVGDWIRLEMEVTPQTSGGTYTGNPSPELICTYTNLTAATPPEVVIGPFTEGIAPSHLQVSGPFAFFLSFEATSNSVTTTNALVQNIVHTVSPILTGV